METPGNIRSPAGRSRADHSHPDALAAMLAVDDSVAGLWQPGELAAILRHQLDAPLRSELAAPGKGAAEDAGIHTFADLLHHPSPPADLLVGAKDFAKASRQDPSSPLPKEIAAVIYFGAITVARQRLGRDITRLDGKAVREGTEWVLSQPWVDPATRSIFEPRAG